LGPEFQPLFRNPHLLTIAGNFWPRKIDQAKFPAERRTYRINDRTTVVGFEHNPTGPAIGQLILLHGLEGSADAGYIASFAQEALTRGFKVCRLNMRTCGGTEELCESMYHSGLTDDMLFIVLELRRQSSVPVLPIGFSLGGNVVLKLAGELGETDLLAGAVAISAPIDLAAAVRAIDKRSNILYARRFITRLQDRVKRKSRITPELYSTDGLKDVKTIWQFDDRFTAPLFGFGTAARYYATQSALNFVSEIRVPTLVVAAQDDPLVPFEVYRRLFSERPAALELVAPEHGGHLGFLSRVKPRFWVDNFVLDWISRKLGASSIRVEE
jgi:predicted alpha/beta-fold hydrolase